MFELILMAFKIWGHFLSEDQYTENGGENVPKRRGIRTNFTALLDLFQLEKTVSNYRDF
jgi:hypothetical protein